MKIYSKLLEIRKSVDYFQKTETGSQGAKYVDPAILLKKIRDQMNEKGLILIPELSDPEISQIPMPTKNNPEATGFLFKAVLIYTFLDCESDEKVVVPWFVTGKHGQDPSMASGAGLTFFERYFLLKFFQIPTSKDDPEHFTAKTATALTEDQAKELSDLVERTSTDLKAFLAHAKADTLENIQPAKFGVLKAMLLTKEQKRKEES